MRMSEQEYSEYQAENALQDYESSDFISFSIYKKEKIKKVLHDEIAFLRENYPDSYFLGLDLPAEFK